jgi:magnesium chelatase accessory protein
MTAPPGAPAPPTPDGIRWNLRREGQGPLLLLLHGTGGSLHGWDRCLPLLAPHYTVLRLDLPGHGGSRLAPSRPPGAAPHHDPFSLRGMADAVGALLAAMDARPVVVAGHSAGFPLALRLVLDGAIAPARLVGICPALVPPPALLAATLGAPMAALATTDLMARGGAWMARHTGVVPTLLGTTGSTLPPEAEAQAAAHYAALCADPAHVHAALAMMARWTLRPLLEAAHAVRPPITLVAGTRDRWVPLPALHRAVRRYLPQAFLHELPGGHLLPEEAPVVVAAFLRGAGAAPP